MKQAQGTGSANGKIILMGEHAVVYGQPAIAIPFPATQVTTMTTLAQNEMRIDCQLYKGLLKDMPELLESLKKAIELSLSILKKENIELDFKITSTIPAERGMGSSAAVAVATTRSIFDFFDAPLSQSQLLNIVDEAEKIAHGNPSGLDGMMTSGTQPCYFIKNETPKLFNLNLDAVLVVADTGQTGQTKEAVAAIGKKINSGAGEHYQKLIAQLGRLAEESKLALTTNDREALGNEMTAAHTILQKLNVSSPALDKLTATALAHGALGAKLTGGGRGGCLIALAENTQAAEKIASALTENGAKSTWLYEMSDD